MDSLEKIVEKEQSSEKTISDLEELFSQEKRKELDSIFVEIISSYLLPREKIKILWKKVKVHGTYQELTEKYLLQRKVQNFGFFFETLIYLYDKQLSSLEIERMMTRVIRLRDKTLVPVEDVIHYLTVSKGQRQYAQKPDWVNVQEGENLSLLTTVSPGGNISEKRYKDLLDEATDIFYSFEKTSDGEKFVKEKIDLDIRKTVQTYLSSISSVASGDQQDEHIADRVFGPQNRFKDKECPYNLNEIGPCRMLNCYCRGNGTIETEADSGVEWFDGFCDVCNMGIMDKSHALRYPYRNGGWTGVYCCFECLQKSDYFGGIEDMDQYIRLENLRQSLETHGIMDRTDV